METRVKRVLAILLVFALSVGLLPAGILANPAEAELTEVTLIASITRTENVATPDEATPDETHRPYTYTVSVLLNDEAVDADQLEVIWEKEDGTVLEGSEATLNSSEEKVVAEVTYDGMVLTLNSDSETAAELTFAPVDYEWIDQMFVGTLFALPESELEEGLSLAESEDQDKKSQLIVDVVFTDAEGREVNLQKENSKYFATVPGTVQVVQSWTGISGTVYARREFTAKAVYPEGKFYMDGQEVSGLMETWFTDPVPVELKVTGIEGLADTKYLPSVENGGEWKVNDGTALMSMEIKEPTEIVYGRGTAVENILSLKVDIVKPSVQLNYYYCDNDSYKINFSYEVGSSGLQKAYIGDNEFIVDITHDDAYAGTIDVVVGKNQIKDPTKITVVNGIGVESSTEKTAAQPDLEISADESGLSKVGTVGEKVYLSKDGEQTLTVAVNGTEQTGDYQLQTLEVEAKDQAGTDIVWTQEWKTDTDGKPVLYLTVPVSNGLSALKVKAIDAKGRSESYTYGVQYAVDRDKPVIKSDWDTVSGDAFVEGNTYYFASDVTLNFSIEDVFPEEYTQGESTLTYTKNGAVVTEKFNENGQIAIIVADGDVISNIAVVAFDKTGNESSYAIGDTVIISDTTDPVIELWLSDEVTDLYSNGNGDFVIVPADCGSVTVYAKITDVNLDDVAVEEYMTQKGWTAAGESFVWQKTLTVAEQTTGSESFAVMAVDKAQRRTAEEKLYLTLGQAGEGEITQSLEISCNAEKEYVFDLNLDRRAPAYTIDGKLIVEFEEEQIEGTGIYKGTNFNLLIRDKSTAGKDSGILSVVPQITDDRIQVAVAPDESGAYVVTLTVPDNAESEAVLTIDVEDNVHNKKQYILNFKVDNCAPRITVEPTLEADNTYNGYSYYNEAVSYVVKVEDMSLASYKLSYTINGVPHTEDITATGTVSTYNIALKNGDLLSDVTVSEAKDKVGHQADKTVQPAAIVDTVAPEVTLTFSDNVRDFYVNDDGTVFALLNESNAQADAKQKVSVTIQVKDRNLALDKGIYPAEASAWTGTCGVNTESTLTLVVESEEVAQGGTTEFNIDVAVQDLANLSILALTEQSNAVNSSSGIAVKDGKIQQKIVVDRSLPVIAVEASADASVVNGMDAFATEFSFDVQVGYAASAINHVGLKRVEWSLTDANGVVVEASASEDLNSLSYQKAIAVKFNEMLTDGGESDVVTLSIKIVDNADKEVTFNKVFIVDTQKPRVEVELGNKNSINKYFLNAPQTIKVKVEDMTFDSSEANSWLNCTANNYTDSVSTKITSWKQVGDYTWELEHSVDKDGDYSFAGQVLDLMGKKEDVTVESFVLDQTHPAVKVELTSEDTEPNTVEHDGNYLVDYYSRKVVINVKVSDVNLDSLYQGQNCDAVAYVRYKIRGIDWRTIDLIPNFNAETRIVEEASARIVVGNSQCLEELEIVVKDNANLTPVAIEGFTYSDGVWKMAGNDIIVDTTDPTATLSFSENVVDFFLRNDKVYVVLADHVEGESGTVVESNPETVSVTFTVKDHNLKLNSGLSGNYDWKAIKADTMGFTFTAPAVNADGTEIQFPLELTVVDLAGRTLKSFASEPTADGKVLQIAVDSYGKISYQICVDRRRPSGSDTEIPEIVVEPSIDAKDTKESKDVFNTEFSFEVSVGDSGSGLKNVVWSLTDEKGAVVYQSNGFGDVNGEYTIPVRVAAEHTDGAESDVVTLRIDAEDNVGNKIFYEKVFILDTLKPRVTVTEENTDYKNDIFLDADQMITIEIEDLNLDLREGTSRLHWSFDGVSFKDETWQPVESKENTWRVSFEAKAEGDYSWNLLATDYADNTSTAAGVFVIDKTDPVVNVTFTSADPEANTEIHEGNNPVDYYTDDVIIDITVTDVNLDAEFNGLDCDAVAYVRYKMQNTDWQTIDLVPQFDKASRGEETIAAQITLTDGDMLEDIEIVVKDNADRIPASIEGFTLTNGVWKMDGNPIVVDKTDPTATLSFSENVVDFFTKGEEPNKIYLVLDPAVIGESGIAAGDKTEVSVTFTTNDLNIKLNSGVSGDYNWTGVTAINDACELTFTKTIEDIPADGVVEFDLDLIVEDLAGNTLKTFTSEPVGEGNTAQINIGDDGKIDYKIVIDRRRPTGGADNALPTIDVTYIDPIDAQDGKDIFNTGFDFGVKAFDKDSGLKNVVWSLTDAKGAVVYQSNGFGDVIGEYIIPVRVAAEHTDGAESDVVTLRIDAEDNVGNKIFYEKVFIVDTLKPRVTIGETNHNVKNGYFFDQGQTITIEVEDLTFDINEANSWFNYTFDDYISDELAQNHIVNWNSVEGKEHTWQLVHTMDADGDYACAVQVMDLADNKADIDYTGLIAGNENGWQFVIDKTDPVVNVTFTSADPEANTEIHEGNNPVDYYTDDVVIDITVTDVNLDAKFNGLDCDAVAYVRYKMQNTDWQTIDLLSQFDEAYRGEETIAAQITLTDGDMLEDIEIVVKDNADRIPASIDGFTLTNGVWKMDGNPIVVDKTDPTATLSFSENVVDFFTKGEEPNKIYLVLDPAVIGESGIAAGDKTEVSVTFTTNDLNIKLNSGVSGDYNWTGVTAINDACELTFTKTIEDIPADGVVEFDLDLIVEDLAGNTLKTFTSEPVGEGNTVQINIGDDGKIDYKIVIDRRRPTAGADNALPTIEVTYSESTVGVQDGKDIFNTGFDFGVKVFDKDSGLNNVVWSLTDAKGAVVYQSNGFGDVIGEYTIPVRVAAEHTDGAESDVVTLRIDAEDNVGNKIFYEKVFIVDTLKPRVSITESNRDITCLCFLKQGQTITIEVEDLTFDINEVNSWFHYTFDDYISDELAQNHIVNWNRVEGKEHTWQLVHTMDADGDYVCSAQAMDLAGNKAYIDYTGLIAGTDEGWEFVIDQVRPVVNVTVTKEDAEPNNVNGVDYYSGDITFEFTMSDINLDKDYKGLRRGSKAYVKYKLQEDQGYKIIDLHPGFVDERGFETATDKLTLTDGQMLEELMIVVVDNAGWVPESIDGFTYDEIGGFWSMDNDPIVVDKTAPTAELSFSSNVVNFYTNTNDPDTVYLVLKTPTNGDSGVAASQNSETVKVHFVTKDRNLKLNEGVSGAYNWVGNPAINADSELSFDIVTTAIPTDDTNVFSLDLTVIDLAGNPLQSFTSDPVAENISMNVEVGQTEEKKGQINYQMSVDRRRPTSLDPADTTLPTIEITPDLSPARTTPQKGDLDLFGKSFNYTLKINDGVLNEYNSGVAYVKWTLADPNGAIVTGEKEYNRNREDNSNITVPVTVVDGKESNEVTLTIVATDFVGNTVTYVKHFAVDNQAPRIVFNQTDKGVENTRYFKNDQIITITVTDLNFDVDVAKSFVNNTGKIISGWETTDNMNYKIVVSYNTDGEYTYAAQAMDRAGNTWTPDYAGLVGEHNGANGIALTIDKTDPVITVTYSNSDDNEVDGVHYYKDHQTVTVQIAEKNFSQAGIVKTCRNDAGTVGNFLNNWGGNGINHTSSHTFKDGNRNHFTITYTDLSGRQSVVHVAANDEISSRADGNSFASGKFTVDTNAPSIKVKTEAMENGKVNVVPDELVLEFEATDPQGNLSNDVIFDVQFTGINFEPSAKENPKDLFEVSMNGTVGTIKMKDIPHERVNDGVYCVNITVSDCAGNQVALDPQMIFSLNRFGSTYVCDSKTALYLKIEKGDELYKKEVQELVITEYNPSKVFPAEGSTEQGALITLSVNGKTTTMVKDVHYTMDTSTHFDTSGGAWNEYTYTILESTFKDEQGNTVDGEYTILFYSEDEAGRKNTNESNAAQLTTLADNKSYSGKINFHLDSRQPEATVIGLEDGEQYKEENKKVQIDITDSTGVTMVIMLGDKVIPERMNEADRKDGESWYYYDVEAGHWILNIAETDQYEKLEIQLTDSANNSRKISYNIQVTEKLWELYIANPIALISTAVGVVALAVLIIVLISKRKKKKAAAAG